MRIAITADMHLKKDEEENNKKYNALHNIIKKMFEQQINKLIIAGDLFDKGFTNYNEFEVFCRGYKDKNIEFHIIPGNHDYELNQNAFNENNIYIYDKPVIKRFDNSKYPLVLIPYSEKRNMGDELTLLRDEIEKNKWILISHGDWLGAKGEQNTLEPGIYMPLTQRTLDNYKPKRVILGHIHRPSNINKLITYCGSPVGLDITETGKRRFLVFDTESADIESFNIDTDIIYYIVDLVILPIENEEKYIMDQISDIIKKWDLSEEEKKKARIRINVSGYSANKAGVKEWIEAGFKNFQKNDDINMDNVNIAESDLDLNEISHRVIEYIKGETWEEIQNEPDINSIIIKALETVYGVK